MNLSDAFLTDLARVNWGKFNFTFVGAPIDFFM